MYFDGDLISLMNEISEYFSEDQALELIEKLDDCLYAKTDEDEEKLARQARVEIGNIILAKNRRLLQENKITEEEYEREVIKSVFFVKDYKLEIDDFNEEVRFAISSNPNYSVMPLDAYRIIRNRYFMNKQEPITFYLTDAEINYNYNDNDIVDYMRRLSNIEYLIPNNKADNDAEKTTEQTSSKENTINTELNIMFDDYTSPTEDSTHRKII